jgi:DNA-binding CsgD family transcriptional regulator
LEEVLALAGARPGAVVIAGEPGAGASRLAREAAGRLSLDGAVVVSAEEPGPGIERLERALRAAGHTTDAAGLARIRPLVILLGDRPDEPLLGGQLARRLKGTRALVLLTAHEPSAEAPTVEIGRLEEADAARLAAATSPGLAPGTARAIGALGDGLPGRILPLALAARRWPGGEAPLPIPDAMAAPVRARLMRLEHWPRDLAGWVAVVGDPVTPQVLSRVCREAAPRVERGLEELVHGGILVEQAGPPLVRWAFCDRLTHAVVRDGLGGAERRRRHAAALVSGRAAGQGPAELLSHALGAADPEAIVAYGTRAARLARGDGDPEAALTHAARALAWWSDAMGESARLAALHEKGMALLDLSAWAEAAESLEAAANGRRELGEREPALASVSAASSARWNLGQHDAALRALQDHLARSSDPGQPRSAERGEALTQAAGMAVMTSRFADAMALAGEAREEASAAGADEISTRALIFMGMAESGRGSQGGLLHLSRARREGERATGSGQRNETLAMIHESHVLLALGRPDDAAACARQGAARARELGLIDHELVLAGNLGEALTAAGDLAEGRQELERAAQGWSALGRATPSPADPGLAWLLLAEGRIDDALRHYRELAGMAAGEAQLFEQIATVAAGHALAALSAGEEAEAGRVLAAALAAWRGTDDRLTSVLMLATGAEVLTGPDADACVAALADAASAGVPLAAAAHGYAAGSRGRRRGDEAAAGRLREAAVAFEGIGLRWWAARALFVAGLADGRTDQAAEDLLAARRAFREIGAEGWRRRAEARLRAIGRRIPTRERRPATPSAGLSARELEVLSHLALGLRNRDIGERLFISERTVARHLVQINAKLGVSTRTAAVRAGMQRGLLSSTDTDTTF